MLQARFSVLRHPLADTPGKDGRRLLIDRLSSLWQVLAAALEKGGDYADLFFEHSYSNNIGLQDGVVNRASSNIDFGMGVRVLSGDQTGYAYVEQITLDEMLKAARTAARIAESATPKAPAGLTDVSLKYNYYAVEKSWDEMIVKDKMPYIQKLNDRIFALDSRVMKVSAGLGDTTSHILFCNSERQMYYDYRPMISLFSSFLFCNVLSFLYFAQHKKIASSKMISSPLWAD